MTTENQHDLLRRIDPICEQFESDWQSGEAPRLDEFITSFSGEEQVVLLRYLLEIDRDYRNTNGLPASVEYYEDSMPGLAIQIRQIFASMKDSTVGQIGTDTATQDANGTNYTERVAWAGHGAGERMGNYELLEKLGAGGMGTVYLAEQKQPVRRQVALKVISGGVQSKEILSRFEAERQAMAMMAHPNIARILDAGTTPSGQPYFAMELVQGETITAYVDRKRLGIDERLRLLSDVCSGVQHAHQKGIIHRDLKPSNILVTEVDGKAIPKVIDFGLAKAMESTQKLTDGTLNTEVGQILGTLKYMSPEQAGLNPNDIDIRSDIYALGVILYELLTGVTPLAQGMIKGRPVFEILELIREKEPLKPSSQLSQCKDGALLEVTNLRCTDSKRLHNVLVGDLDWIVMKAIEKDRTRRYESASGFSEDIRRYLENEPITARPPSLGYRARKFTSKHRGLVTAATVVLVALLFGIIGTTSGMVRAGIAEDKAKMRLIAAQAAEEKERKQRKAAEDAEEIARQERAAAVVARRTAERAQADAEQEAQISDEINRFFKDDILGRSDVQRSVKDITVRDALIRAAKRIDGRFDEMPVVEGEIRRTIGRALAGLARFEEGIDQLLQSKVILSDALGPDHSKTLRTVGELGRAYRDWERYEDAQPYLEEYLAGMIRLRGEDSPQAIQAMHMYGMALDNLGEVEKAEEMLTKVLDWRRKNLGDSDSNTIRTILMLGALYLYNDRIVEAEPLIVEGAKLASERFGDTNYATMIANDNLSFLYIETGRYADAEPIVVRGLELCRTNFGENHPGYAATLSKLASLYTKTERFEEAIELRREQVERSAKIFGATAESTFSARFKLASVLAKNKQYVEANEWLLAIQAEVGESLGEKHPYNVIVELELGQLDFKQEDYEAASDHFRTGRQMSVELFGEQHPQTQASLNLLANAAWMQKDYETARVTWRSRLQAAKARGDAITVVLPLSRQVAMAELKLGDVDAAKMLILEVHPQFANIPEEAKSLLVTKNRMLLDLTECHLRMAEHQEAEAVAREVLGFDGWEEDKQYRHYRAQRLLGTILLRQERYEEAETELRSGYEGLVSTEANADDQQDALESLIELCRATNRSEEENQWKAKLDEILADGENG